ncbi:hypothetical protein JTB14_028979 [Gonioctena quinquepunctata]|nr:hypothetical protein JTB14_028979 [Gonioctena quinquepunctata]
MNIFLLQKEILDLSDPRDTEELLNYLEELNSDDESYEQVADGSESDVDDASSDDNMHHGIRDIGKGILRQLMEVIAVHSVEKNNARLNFLNETNIMDVDSIVMMVYTWKLLQSMIVRKNV